MGIYVSCQVFYGVKVDIGDWETFYNNWGDEPNEDGIRLMAAGGCNMTSQLDRYAVVETSHHTLYDGTPTAFAVTLNLENSIASNILILSKLEKWGVKPVGDFGWHATTMIM